MQTNKENIIVEMTFKFAVKITSFTEKLEGLKKYNMANQLFRCGTSIGANVREAQNAESKNDSIHKMKIAAKEADETEYWLLLCKECSNYPSDDFLLDEVVSIQKVLSKIISSLKNKIADLAPLPNHQIIKSSNL
jgi:four helix bundle protein